MRLAVTIPYVQSDLRRFLEGNSRNRYITSGVLVRSAKGREVELLQVGHPGPGVQAVLVTARHHACESMASFVLEGFLQAAMADTPAGLAFRRNQVLYAVPFVDKDGVEEGEQGKNRKPRDHNRDYGDNPAFPEIRAIQSLAEEKGIRFLQDLHCPTLRMDDHQALFFVGTRQSPAGNEAMVSAFARRIRETLPAGAPEGPDVRLEERQPIAQGGNCNRWFSFREGMRMASTLEVPYAPPGKRMDGAIARAIGAALLEAWPRPA